VTIKPVEESREELPPPRELLLWRGSALDLFSRKVAIVFAFAIGLFFLYEIRKVLIILFIAAVLAAGIAPVVKRVRIWGRLYLRRRIARGTAVLIVYLPFLVAAVLVLVFVVPRLLSEAIQLSAELPEMVDAKILTPLERWVPMDTVRVMLSDYRGGERNRGAILGYLKGAVLIVASIIAVLFLVVYMLIDAERLRNLFLLLFPAEERGRKQQMVSRISRRMSGWLTGQLLLAAIIGGVTFVVMVSLRIPYALPLALLAMVGELIPVIGPIVGAVPAVIIALFQSTWQFWSVLAVAILIQKLENLFLVPRLLGAKVKVSPLAIVVAFMVGGTLFGLVGGIMAIPAAVIVQVVFEEVFVHARERRVTRERAGSLLTNAD